MSVTNAVGALLMACSVLVAAWVYRRSASFNALPQNIFFGAVALVFLLSANPSATTEPPTQLAYTLDSAAWQDLQRLSVINAAGNIEIIASEQPRAEIRYRGLEGSDELPAEPELIVSEGGLELTVINPAWPSEQRRGLAADITLHLTPDTELNARIGSGDVRSENILSVNLSTDVGAVYVLGSERAEVQTYAGDITLEQITGIAQVSSNAGSLSLDFAQPPSGPISAKTGAGDVSLSLPTESDVSITAVSESRDLSGDFGEILSPDEGRVRLGQGWHEVSLSSSAGEVSFRLKGN